MEIPMTIVNQETDLDLGKLLSNIPRKPFITNSKSAGTWAPDL
jgi:hypothetical protein